MMELQSLVEYPEVIALLIPVVVVALVTVVVRVGLLLMLFEIVKPLSAADEWRNLSAHIGGLSEIGEQFDPKRLHRWAERVLRDTT